MTVADAGLVFRHPGSRPTFAGVKRIIFGDNADVLPMLPERFARLVYVDPPFNTGKVQERARIRVTEAGGDGVRGGFGGRRYDVMKVETGS